MKKTLGLLGTFSILLAASYLTLVIFANVFERITAIDLPLVSTIEATGHPRSIYQLSGQQLDISDKNYGYLGTPEVLRVPSLNQIVPLAKAQEAENGWYAVQGIGSTITFGTPNGGRLGTTLVFGKTGGPTMRFTEATTEGERLVVDTDSAWRYHYRVSKKILHSLDGQYYVQDAEKNKLILVNQLDENSIQILEADLLNIEKI